MANGWTEFLERVKQQAEEGEVDHQSVWTEFLRLSHQSPRAELILELAQSVQKAPASERAAAATALAALLAPMEWPPEWELHRPGFVEALGELLDTMDPKSPRSLPALLELEQTELLSGFATLSITLLLIRTGCRRDELLCVARLCNIGILSSMEAYRQRLQSRQTMDKPLLGALLRYTAAFERYTQAARALNSAVGEVLFEGLDARLEIPET